MHEGNEPDKESKAIKQLAQALGAKSPAKRPLTPMQWSIAFDRYAVAAAATSQLAFTTLMSHKVGSIASVEPVLM